MERPIGLPDEWLVKRDADGNPFYLHRTTKKLVWNLNDIVEASEAPRPVQRESRQAEYSEEEARQALINLFREKGVNGETSWERANELLGGDARFALLKSAKERKRVFRQFVESERAAVRRRVFDERQRAKADFRRMLEDYRHITTQTKFQSLVPLFFQDPRWKALEEREREEAFHEHLETLFVRSNEAEKERIARLCDRLRVQMLELKRIGSATTWEEARELMYYNSAWNELSDYHRLETFKSVVGVLRELDAAERAEAKSRAERLDRVDFLAFLARSVCEGALTPKTPFEEFEKRLCDEESFHRIIGQSPIGPIELIADFRERLIAQQKHIKSLFKATLKTRVDDFRVEIPFEEFAAILSAAPSFDDFGDRFRVCNPFSFVAKYLHRKLAKRQRSAVSRFRDLLERVDAPRDFELDEIERRGARQSDKKYFASLARVDKLRLLAERGAADIEPGEVVIANRR